MLQSVPTEPTGWAPRWAVGWSWWHCYRWWVRLAVPPHCWGAHACPGTGLSFGGQPCSEGAGGGQCPAAQSGVPFAAARGCHAPHPSAAGGTRASWAPLPIPSTTGDGSGWQEGVELRMSSGDIRLSGCRAGGGEPYGNPGSPASWRWARRPLWCCRGRGGCMFLNPRGGMHASRLWGWHLRWEEAGTP